MKVLKLGMGLLVIAATTGTVMAQETAKVVTPSTDTTNTVITSDRMVFDYKKHAAEFTGHVVVDNGDMHMQSDKMILYFGETNQIQAIKADGNVVIHSEDKDGTCDSAVYRAKDASIQLKGNAKLTRGTESLAGSEIVIWQNDDRMICTHANLVVTPQSGAAGMNLGKGKF